MRYRKKPVVVDAVQWLGSNFDEVSDLTFEYPYVVALNGDAGLQIETLEGWMSAIEGDWIIRGVKGEIYPCKPDIFAATYELAE